MQTEPQIIVQKNIMANCLLENVNNMATTTRQHIAGKNHGLANNNFKTIESFDGLTIIRKTQL